MILLLTDKPLSDTRLVRALEAVGPTTVLDLLDPEHAQKSVAQPSVIVSDIGFGVSATIAALRQQLAAFRTNRPPFVCLLREDTPRSRAQAHALQANHVLDATDAIGKLPVLLARLMPAPADDAIAIGVTGASERLVQIFELGRGGQAIEPSLVQASAGFLNAALHERSVTEWLELVWRFDDTTHQHCLLVAVLAAGFGRVLGLRRADCELLTQGALLHDVGKCRIPVEILHKAGKLDPRERAIMTTHPAVGHAMLADQGYAPELLAVVRSHHELLDGSGYPDRLSGRDIPDLVRLTTICDIFAALIERRPYKAPISNTKAFEILESMTGKLDADLLRAFHPLAMGASGPETERPVYRRA